MARTKRKNHDKTGSLNFSEPEFLVIGKLHRPHGLKGGINLEIMTDFPERLIQGTKVYIGDDKQEIFIQESWQKGKNLIVNFKEYNQPEQLSGLINQLLYVSTSQLPTLPEGDFYHHQLIGLKVLDHQQEFLGILTEIISTGANDVYVIKDPKNPSNELLLPALKPIILEVNLVDHVMKVSPPQWL